MKLKKLSTKRSSLAIGTKTKALNTKMIKIQLSSLNRIEIANQQVLSSIERKKNLTRKKSLMTKETKKTSQRNHLVNKKARSTVTAAKKGLKPKSLNPIK